MYHLMGVIMNEGIISVSFLDHSLRRRLMPGKMANAAMPLMWVVIWESRRDNRAILVRSH
jgi:hypothetical protein